MMPNMEISTVVGCKMNCSYCPQKIHIKKYTEKSRAVKMTMEVFDKCLSKIPLNVEILFAGMAEPWLNPNATEMLLLAHSRGYKIGVYTTTVGMDFDDIDKIKRFDFLHFCIHLPDGDGNMKVEITDEYKNVLSHAMQIKHNLVCIGKIHPELVPIVGEVPDSSAGLLSRAGNLKSLAIEPKKGKLKCSACGDKIDHNILLPNGDVILCCMDYSQEHVLGNLITDSYEDLFQSDEYKRVMNGLEDETIDIKCRQCELAIPT